GDKRGRGRRCRGKRREGQEAQAGARVGGLVAALSRVSRGAQTPAAGPWSLGRLLLARRAAALRPRAIADPARRHRAAGLHFLALLRLRVPRGGGGVGEQVPPV